MRLADCFVFKRYIENSPIKLKVYVQLTLHGLNH